MSGESSRTPSRRVIVYGPAYLDRVVRVDRPLLPGAQPRPLDRSVEGKLREPGDTLALIDPIGNRLAIVPPPGWPGPFGTVELQSNLSEAADRWSHEVWGLSWQDDLGGMGAGFAAAFGGRLICALGPTDDPMSLAVSKLLDAQGIVCDPIRPGQVAADWTLLVSSGEFGDKLPIGFRGCHARWAALEADALPPPPPADLRVVAALPNHLSARILEYPGANVRFFAPAMRNMTGRPGLETFASSIDVISCNRTEWNALTPSVRALLEEAVSLLLLTDGPNGCEVHYLASSGRRAVESFPAFPRTEPPRDTNRAGEAFASTFLLTLLDAGWSAGPAEDAWISWAAGRASAAAALELDLLDFGFPTPLEIDHVLVAGSVRGNGSVDADPTD